MPKSDIPAFRITGAFIELIHDEFVAKHWQADQPVSGYEYRDRQLIESAVNRPFQSFDGKEFYPSILPKAAPLFHSLICNHPFANGNKRTAVVAVDLFLVANGILLTLNNDQMRLLAEETAMHNEKGIGCEELVNSIRQQFSEHSVSTDDLKSDKEYEGIYAEVNRNKELIRNHPANRLTNSS